MKPDFTLLLSLPIRRLIVTAKATTTPYDFDSQFFAPRMGADPETGSARCVLDLFWSDRLGKDDLLAYQASARGRRAGGG
jgi:predicted PhzF superfamily epimerase YddE/YHI9